MSRYFFDVDNTGLAEWDDDSRGCVDRGAVEARVRQLAHDNSNMHDGGRAPLTTSVLNDEQHIVLTALVDADSKLKLL